MKDDLIQDKIFNELQFTQEWVKLGIVNSENFLKLKRRYLEGEDTNTEHYRYAVFCDFLHNHKIITEKMFYRIYKLGKNDPDYAMGRSMSIKIIQHIDCPENLIDIATNEKDKILSKIALKIKKARNK